MFVIRLEVDAAVDKAKIERVAKEKYEFTVQAIESKYEAQLQLQGLRLADFQERVEEQRQANATLMGVIITMAEKPTFDLSNAKFGGGFAADGGFQSGGTYNDFSQTINNNLDEIQQLIAALHSQAEGFPEEKRDEIKVYLGDLEEDLKQPEKRDPKRIKARLLALIAIVGVIGSTVATGTDFANNVLELGKKFGIELVQTHPSPQAKPIDVKSISPD